MNKKNWKKHIQINSNEKFRQAEDKEIKKILWIWNNDQ